MEILFFTATPRETTAHLLDTLTAACKNGHVRVSSTIGSFINALISYHCVDPLVVIQVGNVADVAEINGLKDLLDGLFLIMVADDGNEALVAYCRQLYPRLLCHDRADYTLVSAVIEKRLYTRAPMGIRTGDSTPMTMECCR